MVDWLKIGETVAAIARVAEGVASIARGTRVAVEELIRTIDIVLGKVLLLVVSLILHPQISCNAAG